MTNREIEFRGKTLNDRYDHYASPEPDTKKGVWVYGDLVTKYPHHKGLTIVEAGCIYHEVDPETVGQYTGKTVKTGKVFQDDIGESVDGLFLVRWDEEKAAFVMSFYDYPQETLYLEEMWEDTEIIVNLWDNPELLEV